MTENESQKAKANAARGTSQTNDPDGPIAIVGIGCRFADTRGPREFWEIVRSGRDTVRDAPQHRIDLGYDINHFFDPRLRVPGKISSKKAGFLEHPELFDPAPFGIAPRDALTMEPQQRLMVEVTWDALEDAGIVPESIVGERVAVMLGYMAEDYSRERMGVLGEAASFRGHDVFTVGGMSHAVLSGRIAFLLGVTGPSFTIDTACSSSLIATHLACQSLRRGESKMALAGGVNLFLAPEGNIALSRSGMLSASGACKAFDASADGFVRAEGAGVVVLRPLADALAEGNPIYAVIRGSGISSDGRDGGHMMAPGRNGQAQAMRDAYAQAEIDPAEIHYVETHGTGTMIGDPVEIAALADVMGPGRATDRPLLVASVKGSLGHTESASGVAGLIKAALAIQHRELPAQLHFETPSPAIPWDDVPIRVNAEHTDWPYPGTPLVGVNSFGISGTNAHVVLEAPPAPQPLSQSQSQATRGTSADRPFLLPISAHSENALHELVVAHRDALLRGDRPEIADLAHTLGRRRSHRPHRVCIVASSSDEMRRELDAALENNPSASVQAGVARAVGAPKIVMIFPGQGAQWLGMGRELLRSESVFAAAIDRLDHAYRRHVEWSLREALESDADSGSDWTKQLDVLQPALIAMEIALAELFSNWGIRPDRVIGQSLGEIAAAHVAGILSIADVAQLACHRGRVVSEASGRGAMAVVALGHEAVDRALVTSKCSGQVEIAGLNSPTTTILSGDREAVLSVVSDFDAGGHFARLLDVDFASHCFHMDPLLEAFREGVCSIDPQAARIPFDSTVDESEKSGEDLDGEYWVRNLRQPVAFDRGLARSIEAGGEIFIEVSPHPTLARATNEIAEAIGQSVTHVASLQRGQDDSQSLMTSVAQLFSLGAMPDWDALAPDGKTVSTPLYTYQRKRFWFSERNRSHQFRPVHPLLAQCSQSSIDPRLHSWDFVLDDDSAGFMQDYRAPGQLGAPSALFLELALASCNAIWPESVVTVQNLDLLRPHDSFESGRSRIQIVLRVDGECTGELRISSRAETSDDWTLLATCHLHPASTDASTSRLTRLDRGGSEIVSSDDHFGALERCGLVLGPKCRTLRELESPPHNEEGAGSVLVGRMMLPRLVESEWYGFRAHPALVESSFQLVGALLDTPAALRVRSLGRTTLSREIGSECFCRVSIDDTGRSAADVVRGKLEFFDREGDSIGSIEGFEAEVLPELSDSSEAAGTGLHTLAWRRIESLAALTAGQGSAANKVVEHWIVISRSKEEAASFAAELQKTGASCFFCEKVEDLGDLIRQREASPPESWGLVLLDWPDVSQASSAETQTHRAFRVGSWAVAIREHAARASEVWVATRGMHTLDSRDPANAEIGRTIAREVESFASCVEMQQCRFFDADGSVPHEERLVLATLVGCASPERQFAVRGSEVFVPRLSPLEASSFSSRRESPVHAASAGNRNFRAVHTGREGLGCLALEETVEPTLSKGMVVVEVSNVALTSLDVLTGLGLARDSDHENNSVGVDFAGTVSEVPDADCQFRVGDPVFGLHPGALARRIAVSEAFIARRPHAFDSAESASLAFPFLVARYSLEVVARLRAGERLLIVSAAGGVGQALIQVAHSMGAEVSATASTSRRRDTLRDLGARVLDLDTDPTLDESEEFDVIVSAHAGTAMHLMLTRLGSGGRYIDLCPRSGFERPELGALSLGANCSVSAIDVPEMMRSEPTLVAALLEQTAEDVKSGRLHPIPTTSFALRDADRALRFMAQNRHEGRVCLDLGESGDASEIQIASIDRPGLALARRGAIRVTGGADEIRLGVVDWLRTQGATSVAQFKTATAESSESLTTDEATPSTWIHLTSNSASRLEGLDPFLLATGVDRALVSIREPVAGELNRDRAWEMRSTMDQLLLVDGEPDATTGSLCLSISDQLDSSRLHKILSQWLMQDPRSEQWIELSDGELATRLVEAPSPIYAELETGSETRRRSHVLRAEIISLAPSERRATMERFVCDSLAGVQGLSEEQRSALDLSSPLDSLGLDSLMTMELFMGMGRDLQLEIASDWFEAGPTLQRIAQVLVERLEEAAALRDQN